MFSSEVVKMLYTGFWETIYMTLVSTALGYVIGLPLGVTLAVTGKGGIRENKVVYRILDVISNVIRSIPFLILLILIIPTDQIFGWKKLWFQCYDRTACHSSGTVHCPYGGIFLTGSG